MKRLPLRLRTALLLTGACAPFVAPACVSSNNAAPSTDGGVLPEVDGGVIPTGDGSSFDAASPLDSTAPGDAADAAAVVPSESGASDDAGVDSAVADSGADVGIDAAPLGVTYYVDPVNGLDTNSGLSASAAFKSIYEAELTLDARDASAGPFTVQLAAGTYSAANQTSMQIHFRSPVALVAPAGNTAIFLGNGMGTGEEAIYFNNGGSVQNLTVKDTAEGLEGLAGTFTVSGCVFDGAGTGGYFVGFIGNTVGTLDTSLQANPFPNVVYGSLGMIYVDNTAKLTWFGGDTTTVSTSLQPTLVFMRNTAQITIDRVNVTNWLGYVVVGYDQSNVTINNSTISGSGLSTGGAGPGEGGAIWLGGSQNGAPAPTLALTNTTITGSKASAVFVGTTTNTAAVNLTFTGSHLDNGASGGLWVQGGTNAALAVNLSATSTTFDGNGFWGISSPRATITFAGTGNSVSNNGATPGTYTPGGILLTDAASTNALTLRNAAVGGNAGNQISFAGAAASTLDLGSATTAGAVTFSGVATGKTAVNLTAAIAGTAIGDTWLPSVQGADTNGHFAAGTTLTGAVTGQNATLVAGATLNVSP
jgi:hypothetical protein